VAGLLLRITLQGRESPPLAALVFPRKPPEPPAPAPPQPSLFPTGRGDAEAWSRLIDEYQGRLLRFALARAAQPADAEGLIDEYQGRLLRFALARVAQPADAEDIVQETFTSFIRVANHLQVHVSLETYLFGILRNEIVNHFRTRWARAVCLIQDVYRTGTNDASHGWIFDLVRWRLLLRGRLRPVACGAPINLLRHLFSTSATTEAR